MGFSLQCSSLTHPGKDEKMVGVRSWLRFLCNRLTRILPIHYLITGVLLFKYTSGIMQTNGISLSLSILLELTYVECRLKKSCSHGSFAVFLAPPPSLSRQLTKPLQPECTVHNPYISLSVSFSCLSGVNATLLALFK
jgi:hypothetical protein